MPASYWRAEVADSEVHLVWGRGMTTNGFPAPFDFARKPHVDGYDLHLPSSPGGTLRLEDCQGKRQLGRKARSGRHGDVQSGPATKCAKLRVTAHTAMIPAASRSCLASARSAAVFMNGHISGISNLNYVSCSWRLSPWYDAGVQHVGRDTRAQQAARQIVSEHHLGQLGGVVRVLP